MQTLGDPVRLIQLKDLHRYSPLGRERHDHRTVEPEVVGPRVSPRIEEANELPRFDIERPEIRPLGAIAARTRQREIGCRGLPAMLARDDVVRFVVAESKGLRQQAILAAALGPFGNQPAQISRDVTRHEELRQARAQPVPST